MRSKGGRLRQIGEPRDTAVKLKRSALDLLSRSANKNVTIKDIAREADVNTAMIYYHFRNKDELLCAAIEYAVETALLHFQRVIADIEHPGVVVREWLYMHVEFQSEIGKVLKLIHDYRYSNMQNGRLDDVIGRFYGSERNIIMDSIQRGREMGIFSKNSSEPSALSDLISTFLDGAVMRKGIFADYEIRYSVEVFERMLWKSLDCSAPP